MRYQTAFAVLLAFLLIGCDLLPTPAEPEEDTPTSESSEVTESTEPAPQVLDSLPPPSLEEAEPEVAEQLRQAHADLERVLEGYEEPPTEGSEEALRLAEAFGTYGRLLHAYGFGETAIRAYRNAQHLAPEAFEWPYLLGVLHEDAGRSQDAEAAYRRAQETGGNHPEASLRRGRVLLEQNRLDAATDAFQAALNTADLAYAHLSLGRVAAQKGEHRVALNHFQAALKRRPGANRIYYDIGQSHRQLGELEAAEEALARFGAVEITFPDPLVRDLERQRTGVAARLRRAGQAVVDGRLDEALDHYRAVLELEPGDADLRRTYGLLLGQGDPKAGLEELDEALRSAPENAAIHLGIAQLQRRLERPQEALDALSQALTLSPSLAEARLERATLLAATGDLASALTDYRTFLERVPDHLPARLEAGRLAALSGDTESARRDLETVLEREPQNLLARGILAELLAPTDPGRAADLLQPVAEASQSPAEPLLLADYQLRAQRFQAALATLEAVHSRHPQNPEATHALARLLATHPDPAAQKPTRALALVEAAFQQVRSPYYAETLAMAFAASGNYAQAISWQEAILSEATQSRDPALIQRLRTNLQNYRANRPATNPWLQSPDAP